MPVQNVGKKYGGREPHIAFAPEVAAHCRWGTIQTACNFVDPDMITRGRRSSESADATDQLDGEHFLPIDLDLSCRFTKESRYLVGFCIKV